jgi:hypothetical protein
MKITHDARIYLECGGLFTLRNEGPPLLFSEACLAPTAPDRQYRLQNLLDFGVDRNVGLGKAADLKGLAGSFAEMEEAADVVILVEHFP